MRALAKSFVNGVALALASPFAFLCWLERWVSPHREKLFNFWAHAFALLPGWPGMYLRRAFYRMTLSACAPGCFIGFGAFFSHREATVGEGVYIGSYSIIGSARLQTGCLIGSRVSVLSGSQLHDLTDDGKWTPYHLSRLQQVEIGEHAWVGEGAIIMADIGGQTMVAAGSVVTTPVPAGVVVGGNPARFVRKLSPPEREQHGER